MSYFISDFDGCVNDGKTTEVVRGISDTLNKINDISPIIFVTARATERSMQEAIEALDIAGISYKEIIFRDMRIYQNTFTGLINYKRDAVQSLIKHYNLSGPIFGVGDQITDEIAYSEAGILPIRLRWESELDTTCTNLHLIDVQHKTMLNQYWKHIFSLVREVSK